MQKNTILISACFVIVGFLLYGSAGHDDSHITFWASYTLKEFGEIVNYNGDRIEQSSSLLLTLVTALLAFIFRSDVVITGYVITLLAGAGALLMTARLAQRITNKEPNNLVVLLLATSPAFLLWNTSGMESTLASLCLLWFITAWAELLSTNTTPTPQSSTLAALATLCLISVRPEMITIVTVLAFALFIYRRLLKIRGNVAMIVFYSTVLLSISLLVAFRYFYFGSPMPLPVSAKVSSLSLEKMYSGFYYVLRYGFANIIFIVGALIAFIYLIRQLILRPKADFYLLLSALALLSYTGFILLSGGDWMQMGRFLVPVLPLAAILCTSHLQRSIKKSLYYFLLIAAMIVLNLLGNWNALRDESHGTPIWASYHISPTHQQRYSVFEQYNQEHLRDMDAIDTLDNTIDALIQKDHQPAAHQPITLMSGQSGMVFYYTAKKYFLHDGNNKIRFYDTHALVESSLLKCRLMDDIARSSQGLYFDFDQFFDRQPALNYECNIPKPDILYDINDMTRQLPDRMAAQGYTLIHKEGGKMVETNTNLPTNTLPAVNFIMITNDLFDNLEHPSLIIVKHTQLPLESRW